ncbi:MAG TPA: hypothetical protein ENL35_08160 [Chloroflexi bacterium]|nr:hypothetical protein [Chloroflexota bacterium]
MIFTEATDCMDLRVPLDCVFERPAHERQLVLWSTAIHLLNLVYNTDWSDERKLRKEISGAHSRLRDTLEEMERWLEPS